jgi:SAM-dependent methyltransferase
MNERATVAAGYDALGAKFAEWSSVVADPAHVELFADFVGRLPPGARVLDVGCGSGTSWTGGLATKFALTGIDISPGQIAAARRNVPTRTFLVGDVTAIEFDKEAFDGATALYSIGQLPASEHESVVASNARWLRPGGLLLASLPPEEEPGSTGAWIAGVEMLFASLGPPDTTRSCATKAGESSMRASASRTSPMALLRSSGCWRRLRGRTGRSAGGACQIDHPPRPTLGGTVLGDGLPRRRRDPTPGARGHRRPPRRDRRCLRGASRGRRPGGGTCAALRQHWLRRLRR